MGEHMGDGFPLAEDWLRCIDLIEMIDRELDHVVDEEKRKYEDGTSMVQFKLREGRQHLAKHLQKKIQLMRNKWHEEDMKEFEKERE